MERRHVRYFVAVAEELYFRRVAERLHLAQPSLGRQVRDLEEEIGERLFERDRKHVALTDAGHVLLGEARGLLAGAAAAIHAAREAARGKRGTLYIGNVGMLSASFLPGRRTRSVLSFFGFPFCRGRFPSRATGGAVEPARASLVTAPDGRGPSRDKFVPACDEVLRMLRQDALPAKQRQRGKPVHVSMHVRIGP